MLAELTPNKNQSSSLESKSMNLLIEYCKDINEWPDTWKGDNGDIKIGKAILEQFKLFLADRIEKGRAKKTVKTYAGYLWALGGELIRQINEDRSDRKLSAKNLILKYIDDSGGLYWRHAYNEEDHARYDAVCSQLFKFMKKGN